MRLLATIMVLAAASASLVATTASDEAIAVEKRGTHIVKLDQAPLASYRGGVAGLAPTSPAVTGADRLAVDTPASKAYLAHLDARHRILREIVTAALGRSVTPSFRYRYAFNGMALDLTDAEAARVAQLPGVASVRPEFRRELTTDAGPEWIGAPAIWSGEATRDSRGTKGEGVVVGVIDTGVNHDHPSFADVGGDGYDHRNPRGTFYGLCAPVTGLPFCNDKLIGVHDFTGTTPMDDNGHGSHTASTAAGNAHTASLDAPTTSLDREISGVAPHANLITYKACVAVGCLSPSLVAAIDQAVADQVDVINYSIGGGPTDPWGDADSEAFLNAREAGVFVATSAGNSGPGPETVGSPANAPWVMSVGASTHNRAFTNNVTDLSGGASTPPGDLAGAGLTAGYGPAPIVHARDYGDELCGAPFPPGTFDGEIVVCDRGVNPRVEKGSNVAAGGAGGMVLVNLEADGESVVADPHELPAVHLGYTPGKQLTDWLAEGEGHTGTISGTVTDEAPENGDVMAGFSSRGPNAPVPGVIKPDVTAPGVDVLAAFHTVDPTAPAEYGVISGTSMSSPHAAGAAALVRAVHPDWSAAEVQSALTSTGVTEVLKDDGTTPADPFDMGGGRIDLTRAAEAGLVLDVPAEQYAAADPAAGGDPRRLNLATLGDDQCAGGCTWARTVTNATGAKGTWRSSVDAPEGVSMAVKPKRFTLAHGESLTLTVTADVSRTTSTDWVFGAVNLRGGDAPVQRFPVAVLPGGSAQEIAIEAQDSSGSHVVELESPVDVKSLTATVFGLEPGREDSLTLEQDPTMLDPYDSALGTRHVTVEVAAGARLLSSEITDTSATDLDLFVGRDSDGDGAPSADEEICRSASETALESCTLTDLEAGTYWVMVQNWLSGTVVDEADLVTTVVPGQDQGNLEVVGPKRVRAGDPLAVRLAWDEERMTPGTTWNALVQLGSDANHPTNVGTLLVRISRAEE
jgi:subtilisin family serine protease